MTFLNHYNNLCFVTLDFPPSTPPSSSTASPSSTSSNGWTERITKKIDELKSKPESLTRLKEAQNGYLTEQDSKSLDSLPTQLASLETVHKLAEFADQLDTNKNPSTNILTNLCSGLETFLGFNPSSKGYTGQGIVYSDLDRLCDAVMGFLSGVLSNIQGHLGQHKNVIQPAIDALNKNKHLGKKGFNVAIGAVVAGVRGYNKAVKKSNDDIKNPMKKLIKNIGSEFTDAVKLILSSKNEVNNATVKQAEEEIKSKLLQCKHFAKEFNDALNATKKPEIKKAIDDFNSNLAVTVKNALKAVSHESKRLDELSEREHKNLDATTATITKVLSGLRASVIDKINRELNNVFRLLTEKATNILEQLNKISESLQGYIKALKEWMETAERLIEAAEGKVKTISDEVTVPENGQKPNQWKGIEDTANAIDSTLEQKVKELGTWNTAAGSVVNAAQGKCGDILQRVHNDDGAAKTKIGEAVKKLQTDAEKLWGVMTNVHGNINRQVDEATRSLQKVKSAVMQDLKQLREAIRMTVVKYFDALGNGEFGTAAGVINASMLTLPGESFKKWLEEVGNQGLNTELKNHYGYIITKQVDAMKAVLYVLEAFKKKLNGTSAFTAMGGDAMAQIDTAYGEEEEDVKITGDDAPDPMKHYNGNTGIKLLTNPLSKINGPDGLPKLTGVQDSLGKPIQTNTFSTLFSTVESQLKDIAHLVDSKTKRTTVIPGGNTNDGVQQYIADITSMLSNNRPALTSDIGKQHQSVQGLEKIKEEIRKLKDKIPVIKIKVHGLCDTIKVSAHFANEQLVTLKTDNIKAKLEAIKEQLHTLQSADLTKVITHTENLLRDIRDMQRGTIKEIISYIEEQIEIAETSLDTHARKQYVCSIQFLIEKFVEKVTSELNTLPQDIHHDVNIGVKGFMMRLETHFLKGEHVIQGIDKISDTPSSKQKSPLSQGAEKFNTAVKAFYESLAKQKDLTSDLTKIEAPKEALRKLLAMLAQREHFNHEFSTNLYALESKLGEFKPSTYGEGKNPFILEAVRSGLTTMVQEFGKAYVSRYSGKTYEPADERNYAKVFLTSFYCLHENLDTLNIQCARSGAWNGKKCYENEPRGKNPFGQFMRQCGYEVHKNEESNDGALKYPADFTGNLIYETLFKEQYKSDPEIEHLRECKPNGKASGFTFFDLLECLLGHVEKYNEVCHIPTPTGSRQPCSVYDMLAWVSGLQYTAAYSTMRAVTISDLFDDPQKLATYQSTATDFNTVSIKAHPQAVTYGNVLSALDHLCSKSYDIVTRIAGTGDAATFYGIDLCNNSLKFKYPTSGEDCLYTLLDLLRRLFPQLRYLLSRCNVTDEHHGWSDCLYGKDIPTTKSHCGGNSMNEVTCQPNCQAKTKVKCQPTSPLMNYLNDCLAGHLPHQLIDIGCKAKCTTCSKSTPGMPCLTPLGFRAFSGSTKTGRDICTVLREFFNDINLQALLCLWPKPPSTLPEHFQFALTFVGNWHRGRQVNEEAIQTHIQKSIGSVSINLYKEPAKLTDALRDAYGSQLVKHSTCQPPHLSSLTITENCKGTSGRTYCAPYVSSLCEDYYTRLPFKNAATYVTWAAYFSWDFWNMLNDLYNAFCSISCRDWGCNRCMQDYKCRGGKHGDDKAYCRCKSLVSCKGVAPTFYKYGFCFGDAVTLNSQSSSRRCSDFCQQLHDVLSSTYFATLFDRCDDFLFKIRGPFLWMTVALWSLSLFYLICVMVGRLDVLHIRSHLRIPSSHKITAQSLLAAAQVGRLAKISYLQP